MKYDMVFDTQRVYKKVLKAMSHPGKIISIQEELEKLEDDIKNPIFLFSTVLLDAEVSYYIDNPIDLNYLFYAKKVNMNEADYVFLDGKTVTFDMLKELKIGTLERPDLSASVYIKCENITQDEIVLLKGPGIKTYQGVSLGNQNYFFSWIESLEIEYPLGFDVIFYDETTFFAFNRTTKAQII